MRRRIFSRLAAVVAAALVGVPSAMGADPRDIARDLEDGRLDGTYTAQELAQFLGDATVQGYGAPEVDVVGADVQRQEAPAAVTRGALPFSGVDLALMTAGGIALLVAGAGLRRFVRSE